MIVKRWHAVLGGDGKEDFTDTDQHKMKQIPLLKTMNPFRWNDGHPLTEDIACLQLGMIW